jgi:hypothetical protein
MLSNFQIYFSKSAEEKIIILLFGETQPCMVFYTKSERDFSLLKYNFPSRIESCCGSVIMQITVINHNSFSRGDQKRGNFNSAKNLLQHSLTFQIKLTV